MSVMKRGGFLDFKNAGTKSFLPYLILVSVITILAFGIFYASADVAIGTPPNASFSTNGSMNLRCNVLVTSDVGIGPENLTNVSLWTNVTGVWAINQTVSAPFGPNGSTIGNIFNNTQVQFNLTALGTARGYFGWNCSVSANMTTGALETGFPNSTRNNSFASFTVDRTSPRIKILSPMPNATWTSYNASWINSSTSATWTITLEEHNLNLSNATLYYRAGKSGSYSNESFNCYQRDSSGQYNMQNNCSATVDLSTRVSAGYGDIIQYYIGSLDYANNTGNNLTTEPHVLVIDNVVPFINLFNISTVNWVTRTSSTSLFNVSFTVGDISNQTCTLLSNLTGVAMTANTSQNFSNNVSSTFTAQNAFGLNVSGTGSGVYNFSMTCNDSAGNSNVQASNLTIVVDTQKPNLTVNGPGTAHDSISRIVSFQYTPADNFNNSKPSNLNNNTWVGGGNDTCFVWTNMSGSWAPNYTASNYSGAGFVNYFGKHNITLTFSNDGDFLWAVQCNDTAGNFVASSNGTVTVDQTAPTINAFNSTNINWISKNANKAYFNFTVNVSDASNDSCTIYTNLTGSVAANVSAVYKSGLNVDFPVINFSGAYGSGVVNITFSCNDTAGNIAWTSSNYTILSDTQAPNVTLSNPNASTTRYVSFRFSAVDNFNNTGSGQAVGGNMSCRLWTNRTGSWAADNHTLNVTGFGFPNNYGLINTSIVDLGTAGHYLWNVECNDTAGNIGVGVQNITLTVDSTAPSIFWVNETSIEWNTRTKKTAEFIWRINATDQSNNSCHVSHNATGTMTGNVSAPYGQLLNNSMPSINLSAYGSGVYNFSFSCNDTAGNIVYWGSNYSITLDSTAPIVTLIPNGSNNGWRATNAYSLNFTAYDNMNNTRPNSYLNDSIVSAGNESCQLWTNVTGAWIINNSMAFANNVGPVNMSVTLVDGSYLVNVQCNDTAGWTNTTGNLTVKIDATTPILSSPVPSNGSKILPGLTNRFQVTVTELNLNNSPANSTVYWRQNAVTPWNSSNLTCFGTAPSYTCNATINLSQITNAIELDYYFEIVDMAGNTGRNGTSTAPLTIQSDSSPPTINLTNITQANWVMRTAKTRTLNVTVTANDNSPSFCFAYSNMSGARAINSSTMLSYTSGANTTLLALSFTDDGVYNISVACNDTSGNTNFSKNYTIMVDTTSPTVSLSYPSNNARLAGRNVSFLYTPMDNFNRTLSTVSMNDSDISGGNQSCEIWTNMTGSWAKNTSQTNYSGFLNGIGLHNTSALDTGGFFLAEGTYLWNVQCNDTAGNLGVGSSNFTLNIDLSSPSLINWTYNESSKLLGLGFNEPIDMSTGVTLTRITLNYTDGSVANGVVNLANANSTSTTNSTSVFIKLTSGQDAAVKTIQRNDPNGKVNLTLNGNAVQDTLGNAVSASISQYNAYYKPWHESPSWPSSVSSAIRVPQIGTLESWGWSSSTTQSWNISVMLNSLGSNYNVVYYNVDGTSSGWRVFRRTDWAGSTLQYVNNSNDKDYEVNMTGTARFELCCRKLT